MNQTLTRGTTPTLLFHIIGADLTKYARVILTIADNTHSYDFDTADDRLQVTADALAAKLTQEETLALTSTYIRAQVRACNEDGSTAIASQTIVTKTANVLREGVITSE